ncbi:MAG: metallophosphoesterase [Pseudomonadota bacterium]
MVHSILQTLFSRANSRINLADLAPEQEIIVIGDLHGRADLLQRFFESKPAHPVICVGDYVDRGGQSAQVLRMLQARPEVTCLSGNHEEMMLDFLDQPDTAGARWLRYGGVQTLDSFGITSPTDTCAKSAMFEARDRLADAMGAELVAWMRELPSVWQTGNVAVVHAGADPDVPMTDQSEHTLRWGHPHFERKPRTDCIWVVHGHTIVKTPRVRGKRISIDTGAYVTGHLTVATIAPAHITFDTIA